jgi:hypothetical protein
LRLQMVWDLLEIRWFGYGLDIIWFEMIFCIAYVELCDP